ncbi:MAG: hypothetical protein ACXACB_14565, partial [Promethearchaeota archaeon]
EQLHLDIGETEKKIKEYENFQDFDASQKITNLTKFLNRDKNEVKFYDIIFKLLNEADKVLDVLISSVDFAKKILKFSNSLKKVLSTLPAALSENLQNLNEFHLEIDKVIEKLKGKSSSGILSPFEFKEKQDAAEMLKKELVVLNSDEEFIKHINSLLEMSEISFFDDF